MPSKFEKKNIESGGLFGTILCVVVLSAIVVSVCIGVVIDARQTAKYDCAVYRNLTEVYVKTGFYSDCYIKINNNWYDSDRVEIITYENRTELRVEGFPDYNMAEDIYEK